MPECIGKNAIGNPYEVLHRVTGWVVHDRAWCEAWEHVELALGRSGQLIMMWKKKTILVYFERDGGPIVLKLLICFTNGC